MLGDRVLKGKNLFLEYNFLFKYSFYFEEKINGCNMIFLVLCLFMYYKCCRKL